MKQLQSDRILHISKANQTQSVKYYSFCQSSDTRIFLQLSKVISPFSSVFFPSLFALNSVQESCIKDKTTLLHTVQKTNKKIQFTQPEQNSSYWSKLLTPWLQSKSSIFVCLPSETGLLMRLQLSRGSSKIGYISDMITLLFFVGCFQTVSLFVHEGSFHGST